MDSLKEENELLKKEKICLKNENSYLKEKLEKSKANEKLYQSSIVKMKLLQKEYEAVYSHFIQENSKKEENNQKQFQSEFDRIKNESLESENKYKKLINELTTINDSLKTKIFQLQKIIKFKDKKISDLKNKINTIIKQATNEIKQLNTQLTRLECSLRASNSQRDRKLENKNKTIINKNYFLNKRNNIINLSNSTEAELFFNKKENKNNPQYNGLQNSFKIKNIKYHDSVTPQKQNNNENIKYIENINTYKKYTYMLSKTRNKKALNRNYRTIGTFSEPSSLISDSNAKIKSINYLKDRITYSENKNQPLKSTPRTFKYFCNNSSFDDKEAKTEKNWKLKKNALETNFDDYGIKIDNLQRSYQNTLENQEIESNDVKNNNINIFNESNSFKKFNANKVDQGNIVGKKIIHLGNNKISKKDLNNFLRSKQPFRKLENTDKFQKKQITFSNKEVNRNKYVNLELQKINEQENNNEQSLISKEN